MKIENKTEIRRIIKARALSLSSEYKENSSRAICNKILSSKEYVKANTLFIYLSTSIEVSTVSLIEESWRLGKRVFVPQIVGKGVMRAVEYTGYEQLELCMGIRQPSSGKSVDFDEIDVAVVPSVTCTLNGCRLGHGGGFYDRFLSGFKGYSIGPVFYKLVVDSLPMDNWDKGVDKVITEVSKGV